MKAKNRILKKLLSLTLCLIMILGSVAVGGDGFANWINTFSVKAEAETSMLGSGSSSDPYIINTYAQLQEFSAIVNNGDTDACARLTSDIMSDGSVFTPIGINGSLPYEGVFDGNNKTIHKLTIKTTARNPIAMFYEIAEEGVVKDLTFSGFSVTSSSNSNNLGESAAVIAINSYGEISDCVLKKGSLKAKKIAGICNNCYGTGSIESCTILSGVIFEGTTTCAGIADLNNGTISRCANYANISATQCAGICEMNSGAIRDCFNCGNIDNGNQGAGICNRFDSDIETALIEDCLNTGYTFAPIVCEITGSGSVNISNCYCDIETSGASDGYAIDKSTYDFKNENILQDLDFSNTAWETKENDYPIPKDTCYPFISWNITDDVLTISGNTDMPDYEDREIPWFGEYYTSVVIEPGVSKIGSHAFEYADELSSITLNDDLVEIGDYAFADSYLITNITIPSSVNKIGSYAFEYVPFESITLNEGLFEIGEGAFFGACDNLTELTLPSTLTSIGTSAFEGIVVTAIYNDTYERWSEISGCEDCGIVEVRCTYTVTFNTNGIGVTPEPQKVLEEDYAIQPDSQTVNGKSIEYWYYEGNEDDPFNFDAERICNNITLYAKWSDVHTVTFDTNGKGTAPKVQTVYDGQYASEPSAPTCDGYSFYYWYTTNENTAFDFSTPITSDITLYAKWYGDLSWNVTDNVLTISGHNEMPDFSSAPVISRINSTKHNCAGDTPALTSAPERPWESYASTIKKVVVTGFTSIGNFAFSCMTAVTEYDISESVTSYGSYAFYANTSLSTFTMKNTVLSVGYRAFNDCTNLGSVTLSSTLQKISSFAFCHCKLVNVQIPDSVTDVGSAAFRLNEWSLLSIKFPKNLKTIKAGVCQECYNLNSITFPEDLEVIENNAFLFARFYGGSLTLPSTLKYIGDHAFRYSYGLSEITIPANVTHIGFQAFRLAGRDVTSLSVTILTAGNLDWSNSFVDCANLKTLTLTEGLTSIGSSVFSGCTGLTSVTIPSTVTSIGASAFKGCTALASINIPTKVTTIGANTFNGCAALTGLTLHKGITSLGANAFSSVTNTITYSGTYIELIQIPGYSTCGSTNFTCSNGNGTLQYGSYPQSKVTNSTLIAALNNLTPDSFGDVKYNGEKYRLYKNSYYKYEPITWEVLDTTTGLIVSKKILKYGTYTSIQNGWLNTDFYAVAFSDAEKSMVTKNGNNYARLLTSSDVKNSAYGYNSNGSAKDGKRQKTNTTYAECFTNSNGGTYKYWWLDGGNVVLEFGYVTGSMNASYNAGIVPAMNISFENYCASAQGFDTGDTYSTNNVSVIHNYLQNGKIVSETLSAIETSNPADGYVFTQDDYTTGKKTFTVTCNGQTYTVDILANRHITFNSNGKGTDPESQTIIYGEMATKPSYSKVVDYVVDYWYLDGSESTAFNFANPITEDTVLYAKWITCTHNWGSWVIVKNPTATKTGLMRRICSDCGQVEEMSIPTLQPDYPTSVTLNKSKITLALGGTETLIATVNPDTATDKSVVWATSDSSVVTVSDGVITPVGAGYANITVSTVDNRYAVCQATCLVHIIAIDLALSSANVDLESGIISGIAPNLDSLCEYIILVDGCSFEYSTSTIGTGTKVDIVKNGEVVDTYTAMVYGDVNGDGVYDGMDSIIVNCLANGMLTREKVGEAVWLAADCNHDGVIDNLDVAILEQAGIILAGVDQSLSTEELESDSIYQEYLNLIDQNPEKDEKENEATPTDAPTKEESTEIQNNSNFIRRVFAFIKYIFKMIVSIF